MFHDYFICSRDKGKTFSIFIGKRILYRTENVDITVSGYQPVKEYQPGKLLLIIFSYGY